MTIRSTVAKARSKSSAILRPHLLRAPVVGLVVAGGERVGAEHDPALDLVAEALRRGCARTSPSRSSAGLAQAVADAVVALQVRRRLGRRDHVVGGDPVLGVGQLDLLELAAELLDQRRASARRRLGDAGLDPLGVVGEVAGDAEPQARRGRSREGSSTPPSIPTEVESRGSRPCIAASSSAASATVAGQRAALVERGGEGDHPVARDRAVGGLQADDPAQRGRLADRAAGVGADRPRREPPGDRGRRAARRAARDPRAVPRVAHRAVARVLVRRAHRELVHVRLAEQPRARVAEPAHRGRRVRRPVALEDPRAGGGLDALGAEEVLDRDRQPAQRLAAAIRALPARRARGRR